MTLDRKPIFLAVRELRNGQGFTLQEVQKLDQAIDQAFGSISPPPAPPGPPASPGRRLGAKGRALIHSFESLILETYPDPGSRDGKPVTGGWGTTLDENGRPFRLGFKASKDYWDRLFARDMESYAEKVDALVGDCPTTPDAFDAFCSLAYNIGTGAFAKSSVLRLHRQGKLKEASRAFLLWVKNDGKTMRGLVRRRMAESELYLPPRA